MNIEQIVNATECGYSEVTKEELNAVDGAIDFVGNLLEALDVSSSDADDNPRAVHALLGVTTEYGEYLDAYKKHVFYRKPLDHVNCSEELFDIMYYLEILRQAIDLDVSRAIQLIVGRLSLHGVTLQECINLGGEKLKRRYPDGFTSKGATERNLEKEREALEGGAK